MRRQAKPSVLYFVGLSNGQETYSNSRAKMERVFHECAGEGLCTFGFIRKCVRHYLADSIARQNAPTLGHYERAVLRVT